MFTLHRTRSLRFISLFLFSLLGLTSLLHLYKKPDFASDFDPKQSIQQLQTTWRSYFSHDEVVQLQEAPRRANAAIVMLARNRELEGAVSSIKQLEDRFNKKFNYPWIFLNDEEFSDEFKRRTSVLTNANVSYGLIPREHWVQPEWIDEKKAASARKRLMRQRVLYAGRDSRHSLSFSDSNLTWNFTASVGYRNMCRFNSGFFFQHELLENIRYYWRVEPDVRFYCDIDYDPFLMMQDEGKVYGFNMALTEFHQTIPTLWNSVKEFTDRYPEYVHPDNALGFLSHDGGETYSLCHFWSNFEIADMEFWRGEAYSKFFEHLDHAGGFYYERWGDAPVHSIAAGLFLSKDQLHFFSDIGYKHSIIQHCPQGDLHTQGKCWCNYYDNYDYQESSCLPHFEKLFPANNDSETTSEVDNELVPDLQQN